MEKLSDQQVDAILEDAESRLPAKFGTGKLRSTRISNRDGLGTAHAACHVQSQQEGKKGPLALRHADACAAQPSLIGDVDAGPSWFGLPKTNLTPELKKDLQLLRMRSSGVLHTKRFYKRESRKFAVPEYSQVATVVEGPTEFHTARLTRRERHSTLVNEIMEGERASGRLKLKALEVAMKRAAGKKGFYKKLVARRKRGQT